MSDKEMNIACHKLTKRYAGANQVVAVDKIELELHPHQISVIIGKSGSGKSTLLNLIGLLDDKTGGELYINGVSADAMKEEEKALFRNQNIGFIYQNYSLLPYLNALENVMLPMFLSSRPKEEKRAHGIKLLKELEIENRMMHYPCQMSGGEQQRTAIARAICNNPSLIIADEPTANVDVETEKKIMELFMELREQGKTIIIATHNLEYTNIADAVYKMNTGILRKEEKDGYF